MANEVKITASLLFVKGNVKQISRAVTDLLVTVSGEKYTQIVQAITVSEIALDLGDVGTPGWCWMKNLDATNYVSIKPATGVAKMMKLLAGETALFRMEASDPFAEANTGTVNLEMLLVEE